MAPMVTRTELGKQADSLFLHSGPGPRGQWYLILEGTVGFCPWADSWEGTQAIYLPMSSVLGQVLRCWHRVLEDHLPSRFIPIKMVHAFLPFSAHSFRKHTVFYCVLDLMLGMVAAELNNKSPSLKGCVRLTMKECIGNNGQWEGT